MNNVVQFPCGQVPDLSLSADERLRINKRAKGRSLHAGDALGMLVWVATFAGFFALGCMLF